MAVLLREVKETLGEVRLLRKEDERELEEGLSLSFDLLCDNHVIEFLR